MTFELVAKKTWSGLFLNPTQIKVNRTTLVFNDEITKLLNDKPYIMVYFDRSNNKVGLLPTTDNLRGFVTRFEDVRVNKPIQTRRRYLFCEAIKRLPIGIYNITTEKSGMYVFNVSEIADEIKK